MKRITLTIVLLLLTAQAHADDWRDDPAELYEWYVVRDVVHNLYEGRMDKWKLKCHMDFVQNLLADMKEREGPLMTRRILIAQVVWHMKGLDDDTPLPPGCVS